MLKKKTASEYFERNLEECCEMVRYFKLSDFMPKSKLVLEFFQNYRCGYGLNDLAFFHTALTGMAHFGEGSSTYCTTANSYTKSGLFLVLIGATSKKSRYVQKVYDAASAAEKLLFNKKSNKDQLKLIMFALKIKSMENVKKIPFALSPDVARKITFIEQSLTYAEVMRSLTVSSMFLCAPEGDYILDQLNFFYSNIKDRNEMRGCASALFDGQTITRSTCLGQTVIENKSLSICVGSTGSKWSNILLYHDENKTSDGFSLIV
ncbi:hypothetical protein I4U23_021993 [Adineta vaga]|nr:hypothetical protein I4U23_021993 [Adineta vaga]